jgi:hypothetical protein
MDRDPLLLHGFGFRFLLLIGVLELSQHVLADGGSMCSGSGLGAPAQGAQLLQVQHMQHSPDEGGFDFRIFEEELFPQWEETFRRVAHGAGNYAFYPSSLEGSMYGSADVAYTFYALGQLQRLNDSTKEQWVTTLQNFQEESNDHWFQSRPGPADYGTMPLEVEQWHAAAEATEVLFLLGSRPLRPLESLKVFQGHGAQAEQKWQAFMEKFLTNSSNTWRDSAAVQAPMGISRMLAMMDDSFTEWYFSWLDSHANEDGFWTDYDRKSTGADAMATSFHMFHNYACAKRPWPKPESIVNATLRLQLPNGLFGPEPSTCLDLDGVYTAIRASEQAGRYRWMDVQNLCKKYLSWAVEHLNSADVVLGTYVQHTHLLHGPLFAIAECQRAFPELNIITTRPWQRSDDACIYAL